MRGKRGILREVRDEGRTKNKAYFLLLPSSRDSRSSRASRKMPDSPRLAHKASFMQAITQETNGFHNQIHFINYDQTMASSTQIRNFFWKPHMIHFNRVRVDRALNPSRKQFEKCAL